MKKLFFVFIIMALIASAQVSIRPQYQGYLTWRGDNTHQGQNIRETTLTTANVVGATFKKIWSYTAADGQIYTQPLIVKNVTTQDGVVRNMVYFASQNDTVYALDADTGTSVWSVSVNAGEASVTQTDVASCNDITPKIGVTGTPVIDPVTGTMYLVAKTEINSTTYKLRLHALDIRNGTEKFGGPVLMSATFPGTGSDSTGGNIGLNNTHNLNRSALTLNNGLVYIALASHCDDQPYHGWMLAYDAVTLTQRYVWANAANATNGEGGIWMSGAGPAIGPTGHLYVVTGNVSTAAQYAPGSGSYSNSLMRFAPDLTIVDYFTPQAQATMDNSDLDLGSSGVVLLPDQGGSATRLAVTGGKVPDIWVVNRDKFGGQGASGDPQIPQRIANALGSGNGGAFSTFGYWNGRLYICPAPNNFTTPQACQTRTISATGAVGSIASSTTATFEYPGASPVISANGTTNGIMWVYRLDGTAAHAHLYAYDATNLAALLWDSEANAARDACGMAGIKFHQPTVYNGKVYIAGATGVCAYANF
jgi:hypothetical protein